jgi:curved DNA-binding protein CbpA
MTWQSRGTQPGSYDRISNAMHHWRTMRADTDLAFTATAPSPSEVGMDDMSRRTPECAPREEAKPAAAEPAPFPGIEFDGAPNFYEILQISARADLDTIHRVYRILAARFHPDNPVSGDHERFVQLGKAYEVLSRPDRRAQYDAALQARHTRPMPIFEEPRFVDGLEAEMNRRFGILVLLYQQRRMNECNPGISTLGLERRMALPREHLEFTLWYLRNKGYVQIVEDNSDYAITASGVDHVEANSSRIRIVRELLIAARSAPAAETARPARTRKRRTRSDRTQRSRRAVPPGSEPRAVADCNV